MEVRVRERPDWCAGTGCHRGAGRSGHPEGPQSRAGRAVRAADAPCRSAGHRPRTGTGGAGPGARTSAAGAPRHRPAAAPKPVPEPAVRGANVKPGASESLRGLAQAARGAGGQRAARSEIDGRQAPVPVPPVATAWAVQLGAFSNRAQGGAARGGACKSAAIQGVHSRVPRFGTGALPRPRRPGTGPCACGGDRGPARQRTDFSRSSPGTPDRLECRTFRGALWSNGRADHIFAIITCSCPGAVGFSRGFIRESVALVAWLLGLWLAWHYAYLVNPWLGGALAEPGVREWTGRAIILVLVLLLGLSSSAASSRISRAAPWASLRWTGCSESSSAWCGASS